MALMNLFRLFSFHVYSSSVPFLSCAEQVILHFSKHEFQFSCNIYWWITIALTIGHLYNWRDRCFKCYFFYAEVSMINNYCTFISWNKNLSQLTKGHLNYNGNYKKGTSEIYQNYIIDFWLWFRGNIWNIKGTYALFCLEYKVKEFVQEHILYWAELFTPKFYGFSMVWINEGRESNSFDLFKV